MRRTLLALLTLGALLAGKPGPAQTHKVAKPEQVVRAVGVYEWTGDLKKPDASRLIPVTVFIDGTLEDAGIYLPRPIPFALTPGNQYELEQSGLNRGTLDLAYATHLRATDSVDEDGWFGYGSYKPPLAAKKEPALHTSKNPVVLTSSKDDDTHPRLSRKGEAGTPGASSKPDPAGTPGTSSKPDPAGTSPDPQAQSPDPGDTAQKKSSTEDSDRPTMKRRSDPSNASTDTTASSAGSTSSDEADRPTLRRRSPEDAKNAKKASKDVATVTGTGSLNDDPDRPKLGHRARSSKDDTEIPKLIGLPKDLKQMVAVSDASNRPSHDFSRPWVDDKERLAVLTKMRELAQARLQAYDTHPLGDSSPKAAPATRPATRHPASPATRRSLPASASDRPPQTAPDRALLEEDLKGYLLSYGGAPTYVYTAHTAGTGPDLRYVSIIAQADVNGDLQPAVRSATDEAHLDRAPRLRLIDAVDAEASNRASLLFELRAQSTRQFALYRVIGSRSETIFTTGSTP